MYMVQWLNLNLGWRFLTIKLDIANESDIKHSSFSYEFSMWKTDKHMKDHQQLSSPKLIVDKNHRINMSISWLSRLKLGKKKLRKNTIMRVLFLHALSQKWSPFFFKLSVYIFLNIVTWHFHSMLYLFYDKNTTLNNLPPAG